MTSAPTHHLPEALLIGLATGTGDEASVLVAETHVELCATCRAAVEEVEKVGGALLEGLSPAEVAPGVLDALMARLDEPHPAAPPPPPPLPPFVPAALGPYLHEAGGLRWKWVVPGVHRIELGVRVGNRPVQLIRFRAGLDTGLHGHPGTEVSVVLLGGFTDEGGHYVAGDVAVVDPSVTHRPVADDGEDCILLVAGEGPSLPHSMLGKIVSKLIRF